MALEGSIPRYRIVQESNMVDDATNVSELTTAGTEIPEGCRFGYPLLMVSKSGKVNVKAYGYHSQVGWHYLSTYQFTYPYNEMNHCYPYTGLDRLQITCNGISTGNMNVYWGFAE